MAPKVWLALLCCFPVACGGEVADRGDPPVEVRDSAGVRIVENQRPAEMSRLGWRVGPEPSVSIGALEGEEPYLLHRATARMLPDGRIAVANGGSDEVRVFDASGRHVTTWGGQGEGPGEFSGLTQVARWPGDSLVAWYSQGLSISVFDALGNFGRSFSLQSVETESWLHPRPVEARPDGTILSLNDPEGADTAVVEIRDGEGALSASLGTHPNMIVFVETDEYGNRELSSPAYGPALRLAVWGELVVVGHTSRYEIRAFRADGSLARIVRRDDVLRAPVQADLGPFVEAQMSMLSESSFPAEMLPDARRSLTAAQSSASSTPPDGMDGFMMKSARVRRPTRAARASRSSRQPVEGSKAQGASRGVAPASRTRWSMPAYVGSVRITSTAPTCRRKPSPAIPPCAGAEDRSVADLIRGEERRQAGIREQFLRSAATKTVVGDHRRAAARSASSARCGSTLFRRPVDRDRCCAPSQRTTYRAAIHIIALYIGPRCTKLPGGRSNRCVKGRFLAVSGG